MPVSNFCKSCVAGTCEIHSTTPTNPSYHNPGPSMDVSEEDVQKLKREFRRKQKNNPEPMSIADVFFGSSVNRARARNARRAILLKYITIWFALILVFTGFLLWLFISNDIYPNL